MGYSDDCPLIRTQIKWEEGILELHFGKRAARSILYDLLLDAILKSGSYKDHWSHCIVLEIPEDVQEAELKRRRILSKKST